MRISPTKLRQKKKTKKNGENCPDCCIAVPRDNRLGEVSSGYRRV